METSAIEGVIIRKLCRHTDARGWLTELFREDELPPDFRPSMGYISVTHPGMARGPHEHREQADAFCFLSGTYRLHLWENRAGHAKRSEVFIVGEADPTFVLIPAGVVHGYRNIGQEDAFVLNFPNRLYGGWQRKDVVDEIRYENSESEFRLP